MDSTFPWPVLGSFDPNRTALLAIDMQVDFVGPGGWFDQLGIPLDAARSAIAPMGRLLSACRRLGIRVVHTRESYRPGAYDVADNICWRTTQSGLPYGSPGRDGGRILTRGEPGWELIDELAAEPDEWVVDKPGKSAFWGTSLEHGLRTAGITQLIVGGVTTDVCVQTSFRDAADLGFDVLLASDACAASKASNHDSYLDLLRHPASAVGPLVETDALIAFLEKELAA